MEYRCSIPGCRREVDLIYLSSGICTPHWNDLTADDASPEKLRMVLGIEADAPAAMEADMSEKKTESTKVTKKSKVAKPKREKAPKEDLVVFAFRLTEDERKKIHATAGPANASRFIRQVAAAFASEDEAAFKAVVTEAREARA